MGKLRGVLAKEIDDLGSGLDAGVEARVGSRHVSTELNQVFGLAIGRQRLSDFAHVFLLLLCGDLRLKAADRIEHLNCGIVAGSAELPGKDYVAVENGAHGVANGFVKIVALYQNGKEAGDGALLEIPRALANFGKQRKDRGRIAFLAGRLARSKTDLALGHREPGSRVHHQKDILALIAEVFGNRQGNEAGANAQERGRSDVAAITTERLRPPFPDRAPKRRVLRDCALR